MTRIARKLLRDERGGNLVEFAIALPVLVFFIWGMVQIGLLFQANAGMQHALGQAARHATIFPTPSDNDIRARVAASKFGTFRGDLGNLSIENLDNSGTVYAKRMTLTYSQPTDFLFFRGPTVNLNKSKTVYLAAPTS